MIKCILIVLTKDLWFNTQVSTLSNVVCMKKKSLADFQKFNY